jgi:hypothetical protein
MPEEFVFSVTKDTLSPHVESAGNSYANDHHLSGACYVPGLMDESWTGIEYLKSGRIEII